MHNNRIALPALVVSAMAAALLLAALGAALLRDVPAAPAHAATPPPNDNFGASTAVYPALLPFTATVETAGATLELGETAPCAPIGATVWYQFQPELAGTVVFDTTGSDFDTVLAVYTHGNFLPSPPGGAGSLNNIGCDDNGAGAQSRVAFNVTPYETYIVQAGGLNGATGTLRLHIACDPACPPANDNQGAAFGLYPYAMPITDTRSTEGATREPGEASPCAGIGATVWYGFSTISDVTVEVDSSGSDFDTALAVYRMDNIVPSPPGGLTTVKCADGGGDGAAAKLTFDAKPGFAYYIQAGGARGATGLLQIRADCIPACPPQADNLGDYGLYVPMGETVRTAGATLQPGEPRPCGGIGHTVWYLYWPSPSFEKVSVDTAGSDFDTVVALYEASEGDPRDLARLKQLQCSDRAHDGAERITIDPQPGRIYAVQIGGHNGASGNLQVNADCDPAPCPPFNDSFAYPLDMSAPWGLPSGWGGDITGATVEPGEPVACGGMSHTTWYRLGGWGNATLTFDDAGSGVPVALALYDGPSDATLAQLTPLDCKTANTGGAHLRWTSQPGRTYYVQAGGEGGMAGQVFVNANCAGACPPQNDNINGFGVPWLAAGSVTVDLAGATLEQGEPQPCGPIAASVWYFVPAQTQTVHLSALASGGFEPVIAAYTMEGFSPPPGSLQNAGCSHRTSAGAAGLDLPPVDPGKGYYIQLAGTGGVLGSVQFFVDCPDNCLVAVPAAGGPGAPGGAITGPNTGSGGYLPGARR